MPRPRSYTRWPAQIPRRDRLKLDTGHGSFSRRRLVAAEESYDEEIELKVCLLLWVTRGKTILQRDEELLLQEGDGCLITPGRFRLTEISVLPVSYSESCAYFFNDRVIRDVVTGRGVIRNLAMLNKAPNHGLFPLPGLGPLITTWQAFSGANPFTDFRELFTLMIPRFASVGAFLKHQFYLPRGEKLRRLEEWYPQQSSAVQAEPLVDHSIHNLTAGKIRSG